MRLTSETRELLAEVCTGTLTGPASSAVDSCLLSLLIRRGLFIASASAFSLSAT